MLFKQIYNWIKYKSLPPSFLFKNRLFLERDSKNKRIFTNFGLTFKNTKWRSYQKTNIQNNFTIRYFKICMLFFLILIFFFFVFNISTFYAFEIFFNNFFFFFWILIDTLDYYFSFLFWTLFSFFFFIKNTIRSYLFFNQFSKNKQHMMAKKIKLPVLLSNSSLNLTISDKAARKQFISQWLTNSTLSLIKKPLIFNLFNCDPAFSLKYLKLINLFYTNNYFFIQNLNSSMTSLQLGLQKFKIKNEFDLINYFDKTSSLSNNSTLLMFYFLKNNQSDNFTLNFNSVKFLKNKFFWNLDSFSQSSPNLNLLKTKQNVFYLINTNSLFSYNILGGNFPLLHDNLLYNQLTFAKWNRWLYKYNLIHRKSFKNSHKLTLVKNFLNSGFYNSDLSKKNLWISEILTRQTNTNLLHHTSNFFQFDFLNHPSQESFFRKNLIFNNSEYKTNLNLLKTHETSFFWFLKRIYAFNNAWVNFNTSTVVKTNPMRNLFLKSQQVSANALYHSYLLSATLSSPNLQLETFSITESCWEGNIYAINTSSPLNTSVVFNDLDLLNENNAHLLHWLSTPTLSLKNTPVFSYFDLLVAETSKNTNLSVLETSNLSAERLFNLNLNFLSIKSDSIHLHDIYVASFLI